MTYIQNDLVFHFAESFLFNMCIIHDKLMFAQKELCLRGNPRLLTECTKDREDCFVVSALSSKYQTRDSRVPAPFPGPLHFISRGCTDKNRCESMCDELNITSPMRGSIFRCNVTCCSTSYCTGMCYVRMLLKFIKLSNFSIY